MNDWNVPLAAWALLTATACAAETGDVGPSRQPPQAAWDAARARLSELRVAEPPEPYSFVVRVAFRDPRTRQTLAARGAVAVDPHRALRMVLLGPGGATALDAWVTPDAYRFEVPTIGLRRRGGAEGDPRLPIGFFRWWFLAPAEGRLLASYEGPSLTLSDAGACAGRWFVLREGQGTVTLCDDAPAAPGALRWLATRRTPGGSEERLTFAGQGLSPREGDRAAYEDRARGVLAEVTVESREGAPDPLAFVDPDQAPPAEAGP